jgi:hypothetical protein
MMCEPLQCVAYPGNNFGTAPCGTPASKPACVDAGWNFCACQGVGLPAVFYQPSGNGPPAKLVTMEGNQSEPHSLAIDGVCLGSGISCPANACGAYTAHVYANLPMSAKTPGQHVISIYKFDPMPAACQGTLGWQTSYTVQ